MRPPVLRPPSCLPFRLPSEESPTASSPSLVLVARLRKVLPNMHVELQEYPQTSSRHRSDEAFASLSEPPTREHDVQRSSVSSGYASLRPSALWGSLGRQKPSLPLSDNEDRRSVAAVGKRLHENRGEGKSHETKRPLPPSRWGSRNSLQTIPQSFFVRDPHAQQDDNQEGPRHTRSLDLNDPGRYRW